MEGFTDREGGNRNRRRKRVKPPTPHPSTINPQPGGTKNPTPHGARTPLAPRPHNRVAASGKPDGNWEGKGGCWGWVGAWVPPRGGKKGGEKEERGIRKKRGGGNHPLLFARPGRSQIRKRWKQKIKQERGGGLCVQAH